MIARVAKRISRRTSPSTLSAVFLVIGLVAIALVTMPLSSRAQIAYSACSPGSCEDPPQQFTNGIAPFCMLSEAIAATPGLRVEMSLAPPTNIPTDPYELGKYGRIAVDYSRVMKIDDTHLGLSAQALHVAHHLLFYSAGVTSDINNDGMFLLTAGVAHYQTGNKRTEPFVDAPFMRVRFQSSPDDIFLYSELETTMHFREYISGMAGVGVRLSPALRMMGGYHHTEFVMPTEHFVRQVEGLEGIISWGM